MNLPVVAAWLHDIGIFAGRAQAEIPPHPREDGLNAANVQSSLRISHTVNFIENLLPLPPELENSRSQLARLAAGDAASREGNAIGTAAWLAAGRPCGSPELESKAVWLNSVFARVRLGARGLAADAAPLQYQLLPLSDKDAIFPTARPEDGPDYARHWQDFLAALAKLPCDLGLRTWQASLISLLERYCWCLPYGTGQPLQDISVFDHASAMAAITQAMLACPGGQKKFLLFGGDLSGIQAFIFGREEPADKGAARLLRARSFLLQAVTRSIWLTLLARLNLDPAAKIMDAGGRFALLLPDTQTSLDQIALLAEEAESWLLDRFQGAVRLNIAKIGLSEEDFGSATFGARFEEFNDALEAAKLKPFLNIFAQKRSPELASRYADYGQFGECAFCHTQPGAGLDEDKPICDQCRLLRKLGAKLPDARFIAFTKAQESGPNNFAGLLFDGLALRFYQELPTARETCEAAQILSIKGEPIFTATPIAGHMPVITAEDLRRWQAEGRLDASGQTLMGESCHVNEPKTFTMLAQEARVPPGSPGKPWTCVPCLAICKADVDNLGLVFSLGFGDQFSLSRYAMLARMLSYFFSGYLMRLIAEQFPNIYVVFAGGDDVFVIGPWPETIAFAQRMAGDFRRFCGSNPAISISAGVPLVKAGLPMRAMREMAEECLEQSKNYDHGAKDAVTIFEISAHWNQAKELLETGKWLAGMCAEGLISRGFLRRLLGYSRQCRDFVHGKKLAQNGLYLSHFQYDLARNWEKMSGRKSEEDLLGLQKLACDDERFASAEMGIAWAIYRERIS